MKWCEPGSIVRRGAMLVAAFILTTIPALSQGPAVVDAPQASAISNSLRDLQDQLRALNSAVREMREEVTRSHDEAAELRRELEETRGQMGLLKQDMSARNDRGPGTKNDLAGSLSSGPVAGASFPLAQTDRAVRTGTAPPLNESAAPEQINNRLEKIEDDQRLLETKINDQDQAKVESGSKYRVRLSGIALLNLFGTRGSVDNLDLPEFARPRVAADTGRSFGATVRQSELGLEVFGPTVKGARTSADIQFDFFGGFPDTWDGVTEGLVRIRTARIKFDWGNTSVMAGQDAPFFSPRSPTSLASLGTPPLSYAGNLWTWTPQIHVEHRLNLSEISSIILQAGILDPLTGQVPTDQFYRTPTAGESSGQPAYATRIGWNRKLSGQPLAIAAGGYYARQDWGFGRTVDAWAGTTDWQIPLTHGVSLEGEFYRGRAIGGLGAALGRSALFSGSPSDPRSSVLGLNSAGGWSQLKFRPTERFEFNGAFGEDCPFGSDLSRFPPSRTYMYPWIGRNQSIFVNGIFHARSNVLFSLEYRRLWTSATSPVKYTADHVDMSVGVLF